MSTIQTPLPRNSRAAIERGLAAKTVAIVGLSSKPESASYEVGEYLQRHGYRIIPVNPKEQEVLGERAYPSLRDVPVPVDVVDVFRRAEAVPGIVEDAKAIGAPFLWLQLGIVNEEAAREAEAAGMTVVMDHCMHIEHLRRHRHDRESA
jgi:predicted CoA-binding protein